VTRLVEDDVRELMAELAGLDARLRGVAGIGLAECARRAWDQPAGRPVLEGVRMAAVPISQGEGFIPGFSQCTAAILRFLGADAFVTDLPDVRGLQQAADAEAELVFVADDRRFVALNIRSGACADDDPCTARAYVAALEAAAGGLGGRDVALLGYGIIGRHAAARLVQRGARVLVVEPDPAHGAAAAEEGYRVLAPADALAATDLLFDATPAGDIVGASWVTSAGIAAVPGMPSAFTAEAQALLGERHIHEPLALGVAAMAVDALRR
jgi:3-methylornithyl-N6-L-lysine dehydrogenase